MPDYAVAQQKLSDLRAQYNAELQRVEQDFNTKYEEFLEDQREFPETILRKRQTELKELLERNIAFKNESRRELEKAEAEVMAPLKERLNEVLNSIGLEHGFAVIVNTDANAAPFVHPLMGEDINQMITDALKYLPAGVRVVPQGEYVADSLSRYFVNHPEIEARCSKGCNAHYLTTENPDRFRQQAQIFLHEPVDVEKITLG